MCGRFALFTPPARLARLYAATVSDEVAMSRRPTFNIGPTAAVLGVRTRRGAGAGNDVEGPARVLDEFRWGLVPSWSKSIPRGAGLFNARVETLASKPSFRQAFAARRLVVPADGFYEWDKAAGRRSVPHYFHRADGQPMALAGLWEVWRDPGDAGRPPGWLRSCTVITTAADADMDGIHDRMPVVLRPDAVADWLDPGLSDPEELRPLLEPAGAGTLAHHRVPRRVGDVRNDDAGLIEEAPDQAPLGPPGPGREGRPDRPGGDPAGPR